MEGYSTKEEFSPMDLRYLLEMTSILEWACAKLDLIWPNYQARQREADRRAKLKAEYPDVFMRY